MAKIFIILTLVITLVCLVIAGFNYLTTRSASTLFRGFGPTHFKYTGGYIGTPFKPDDLATINVQIDTTALVEDSNEQRCDIITLSSRYVSVHIKTVNGKFYIETIPSSLDEHRDHSSRKTFYIHIRLPPAECAQYYTH